MCIGECARFDWAADNRMNKKIFRYITICNTLVIGKQSGIGFAFGIHSPNCKQAFGWVSIAKSNKRCWLHSECELSRPACLPSEACLRQRQIGIEHCLAR